MSIYLCEICDQIKDSDRTEIVEVEFGLACLACWQDRENDLEQERFEEQKAFERRRYGGKVYEAEDQK